jgi:hypothetical protein
MRYSDFAPRPLLEVEDSDLGRYDPSEDKVTRQNATDTRKPRLTLRKINRLKKIRATKDLENAKQENLLGIMYGLDANADDDM